MTLAAAPRRHSPAATPDQPTIWPALAARPLSEPMAALLRDGAGLDRYASRSEAVAATAVAAHCAGWDEPTWRDALAGSCPGLASWATHSRRGGRTRPRSAADADRRLRTTWRRAGDFVAAHPPATDHFSVRAELADLAATAAGNPATWGGAAGVSDHAVLTELLAIAVAGCTLTPSASTRQLAEAANVSATTAWKALGRLVERGWLRPETAASGTLAATWRLIRPAALPEPSADAARVLEQLPLRHALARSHRAHDAFAHSSSGGLGRVAARLHDALPPTGQPLSTEQLAAATGLHPRTVTRHLAALARAGLSRATATGAWARSATSDEHAIQLLDHAAAHLGSAGAGARRRALHVLQREAYRAWRADFDARRGWRVERGLYDPAQPPLPIPLPQLLAA